MDMKNNKIVNEDDSPNTLNHIIDEQNHYESFDYDQEVNTDTIKSFNTQIYNAITTSSVGIN